MMTWPFNLFLFSVCSSSQQIEVLWDSFLIFTPCSDLYRVYYCRMILVAYLVCVSGGYVLLFLQLLCIILATRASV